MMGRAPLMGIAVNIDGVDGRVSFTGVDFSMWRESVGPLVGSQKLCEMIENVVFNGHDSEQCGFADNTSIG
jgi:hypothetical protein